MRRWLESAAVLGAACIFALATDAATADDDASSREISARPTFYRDVQPILQTNCQDCHRPSGLNLGGMIAPMPLVTYEDTRPWAKSIVKNIKSRTMPPWHASAEFNGVFAGERTLEDSEIETLTRWAATGSPAGNPEDAPEPIQWSKSEWVMGEPDLVLTLDEPFWVSDDIEDLNINMNTKITAEMLPEDKYIVAYEYKPGSTAVHHIIGYTMPPKGADSRGIQMIGGIAPGTAPSFLAEGYGIKLHAGATFIFQMHYHKEPGEGTGVFDRSSVAFKFADKPVDRLYVEAIGDIRKMYVAAGTKHKITSVREFKRDIIVTSFLPHMHLRGDSALYTAILPDGTRKKLLEVPQYDFNWQTSYLFNDLLELPAGTKMEVVLGYDNTADNPGNPDPTVDVRWGPATTDEMNLGWMTWAYKNPGENDEVPNAIGGQGRRGRRGPRGRHGGGNSEAGADAGHGATTEG